MGDTPLLLILNTFIHPTMSPYPTVPDCWPSAKHRAAEKMYTQNARWAISGGKKTTKTGVQSVLSGSGSGFCCRSFLNFSLLMV